MSAAFAEHTPIENVQRGTVFALIAIPVGIVVWVILWSFGFIASIVGFGVAWLALFLYRFGSGGIVSRTGAIRVTLITIGTLIVAIYAGLVADGVTGFGQVSGLGPIESLTSPEFWSLFNGLLSEPEVWADILPSVGLALLFGALGCFSLLRGAFMTSRVTAAEAADAAVAPVEPANPFELPPTQQAPAADAPAPPAAPTPAAQTPAAQTPATPPPTMLNGEPYNPDQR